MKFVEQEILYPDKVDSWLSRAGSLQKEWLVIGVGFPLRVMKIF